MRYAITLSLIAVTAASGLFAQPKSDDSEKKIVIEPRTKAPDKSAIKGVVPLDSNVQSLSAYEAFLGVTVLGGQYLALQSQTNWTGADHISVTVQCPTTTSLNNVSLVMFWTNPVANFYAATDIILGGNFAFPNSGGAVVPVHGTQLQIFVVNNGTAPIACNQVTTYAVVH